MCNPALPCPFVTKWGSMGSGDGQFNRPIDLAVDRNGNVFIADTLNNCVREVSAATELITTVAGLLVAIPSMFGYNWLVHNLRVLTVALDNFAQELVSKMETEYLEEE